jgi:hypothetical protein
MITHRSNTKSDPPLKKDPKTQRETPPLKKDPKTQRVTPLSKKIQKHKE